MILIDTSGWVEFLRDTASPVCQRVDDLLAEGFVACEPVRMEVLAGARDERHLTCRRNGETVRKMLDCLIASIAIRNGTPLLHADSDFDVLSRHTSLEIDRPGP